MVFANVTGENAPYNSISGGTTRESNTYDTFTIADDPAVVLKPGSNVVAVQFFNILKSGSSDAFFDAGYAERGSVGDDCITIKSGRDEDGRRVGRPCENITVTNCTMLDGHGGVVIGSEMSGGVREDRDHQLHLRRHRTRHPHQDHARPGRRHRGHPRQQRRHEQHHSERRSI